MGKTTVAASVSKKSTVSAPPTTSDTNNAKKSSILKSSFAPSSFQLHLFASVIQSFDSQQLRIHDTNTGRLRQQHSTRPGTTITSLDWGRYGSSSRDHGNSVNKKKRKRAQTIGEVVIAYGTSTSEVCMYSPAEGRLVGTLSGAHEGGIKDFKFSPDNHLEAWSIGGDGKLVQWDLANGQAIKTIPLPDPKTNVLSTPSQAEPQLLCASTTPFCISPSEEFRIESFDSFKGQVHSLKRSGRGDDDLSELFLAADNDRYINVFDIDQQKLVRTLVAGSEVEQLDLFSASELSDAREEQLLAAVTRDGIVELFSHPFKLPAVLNGDLKSKRKNITRKANAQVKLVNDSKGISRIFAAFLQGPDLLIVSIDGGVDPAFQKIRWQDEGTGELLFEGTKEVMKNKVASTLTVAQMNGVKDMGKTHVDESRTVVVNGTGDLTSQDAAIEISSGEEQDDTESENDVEPEAAVPSDGSVDESDDDVDQTETAITNAANLEEDVAMEDIGDQHVGNQEPSFGDLVASKYPHTIAIADSFAPEKSTTDATRQLALPSGMSLGTVLTQALRTNDTNLLESCLHANDAGIIQNTIQRLDSTLAAALLSKLAERLASRPGRYGHLLSWVQWTCIAHGGALASQPDVTARIRTLYRVLTQRSQSLDKLLLLKGKLDMLNAQLTLRKQIQAQRGTTGHSQSESGMVYIEGEEDNWSSDEDIDEAVGIAKKSKNKKQNRKALNDLIQNEASSEDDDDEEMPTVNGTAFEDSEDEEESDEEAEVTGRTKGGLYDVEADVSGEEVDEDDESEDEEDSNEDDDTEEDSSLDGFINDEISYASEEDEIDLDDEPEVRKPEKKKSKHR